VAADEDPQRRAQAVRALSHAQQHRRRASHLYGLVISGSVLAAAPDEFGLVRLGIALVGTLLVYWAAESYAHWIALRSLQGRALRGHERVEVLVDGLPLVAACLVPVVVLLVEALLGVETSWGVRIALGVNVALLVVVGWNMAGEGGIVGRRRVLAAATTGLLGLAMVGLKLGLHH
jgi:hypothetical protein